MSLIKQTLKQQKARIFASLTLNILSGLMSIITLAFINHYLLDTTKQTSLLIVYFFLLILIFLLLTSIAQITLIRLGQNFVFHLQKTLLKQILDTEFQTIQRLGKAQLLASLTHDVRNISFGLLKLPDLVQGGLLALCVGCYLLYLSVPISLLIFAWIGITFVVNHFIIKNVYHYFRESRKCEDSLQENYQAMLEGHRELALNRFRAQHYYHQEFIPNAINKRQNTLKADLFHIIASNWTNAMTLALVGLVLFLMVTKGLGDTQNAITISLAILFMRTPLITAIASVPMLVLAKVSLQKISHFELENYQESFLLISNANLFKDWQTLSFKEVSFAYENGGFALKPINLTFKRGEVIFCVGKNGSGKSTFSLLLSGLLKPTQGEIYIDNTHITTHHLPAYRSGISVIFSDFFLFPHTLTQGEQAEQECIDFWLKQLDISQKVHVIDGKLSTTALSQGQRKRLAMLITLLEEKSILILDEWAADQDPLFRKFFYQELIPLLKAKGITIFAISHDDIYFSVADRILLAKDGVLQELIGQDKEEIAKNAVEKI